LPFFSNFRVAKRVGASFYASGQMGTQEEGHRKVASTRLATERSPLKSLTKHREAYALERTRMYSEKRV